MSLQDTMKDLTKKYGKDVVLESTDLKENETDIEAIPTGIFSLDRLFGCGGFPRGRIVEVYGAESSGKSTLALFITSIVQKRGGSVVWVDAEYAFSRDYAKQIGVDLERLIVVQPENAEQAFDIINDFVSTNEIDLVVLDSVAALVPKAELEGNMEDQQMAVGARIMGKALRKITGSLSKAKSSVVFINQVRDKVGVFFGNKTTTPGGNALKFFASVRIEVKRGESIKDAGDTVIGNKMLCYAVKNKVGFPFRKANFDLYYAKGVDVTSDVFDLAVKADIITKSGNTYSYGETKLGIGVVKAKEALSADEKLLGEIVLKLNEYAGEL